MKALFLLQWQRLKREPLLIGSMILMSIIFVLSMGSSSVGDAVSVPTSFDESINEEERESWLDRLNQAEGFSFFQTDEKKAREDVALGTVPFSLKVMENDYQLLILNESAELQMLDQVVRQTFINEARLTAVEEQVNQESFREEVDQYMSEPPLVVKNETIGTESDNVGYNNELQVLFGMTLFFSMYTIIFSLSKIAEEKRSGTMNRIILSPVRKWQVYLGYMGYSFVIGFVHIVSVFLLFKYVFDFDVGDHFGSLIVVVGCFVFSVVALGMLMLGSVKTLEQLNAVVPIVTVSMAMIGGAYWPIEAVSNNILLAISKVVPVTYTMEALKSIAIYNQNLSGVLEPISIVLLIGVLCMGIGVNLFERKA
ncbi:ABC transporter permease [Tenuibacillus multivorans]|uniref:ABC-2 type transport system permease protein n=1 Tax=Tenuibacillus multivorans TaxID=237069 RepID=A0A1H0AWG9_9BACI|nr:ABC transporter permease [Tenuibacillus multivorans]GEL77787.1 hypothetical protein TMU01_20220 [Tenuibacillus multivorans]SDN37782.1 ABC-2 type transport system permease protein [Tenuibacillus multivorans]